MTFYSLTLQLELVVTKKTPLQFILFSAICGLVVYNVLAILYHEPAYRGTAFKDQPPYFRSCPWYWNTKAIGFCQLREVKISYHLLSRKSSISEETQPSADWMSLRTVYSYSFSLETLISTQNETPASFFYPSHFHFAILHLLLFLYWLAMPELFQYYGIDNKDPEKHLGILFLSLYKTQKLFHQNDGNVSCYSHFFVSAFSFESIFYREGKRVEE